MDKQEATKLVRMGYEQFTLEENRRAVKAFKEHPERVLLNGDIWEDDCG